MYFPALFQCPVETQASNTASLHSMILVYVVYVYVILGVVLQFNACITTGVLVTHLPHSTGPSVPLCTHTGPPRSSRRCGTGGLSGTPPSPPRSALLQGSEVRLRPERRGKQHTVYGVHKGLVLLLVQMKNGIVQMFVWLKGNVKQIKHNSLLK